MKNIILILFTICLSGTLFSQTIITGSIKDQDGQPLGFANIYLEGTYDGTSSEDDGTFTFTTDELNKQILTADFLGYESSKLEININSKAIHFELILKEMFNKLDAVTITAGSFEAGDEKKAAVLKPLDIVTTAGAMGDINGALQTLPGTTTVGESGRLYVRGGSSTETQTYIDGMHVPVAYTNGAPNVAVRGRFNPFMFKGTIFNTGGYSAEYGQALSSVLLLNTKEFEAKDRLDISLMTIGAGISGTKVWDRTAITASLDYTNLTPYFKLIPQRFEVLDPWMSLNGAINFRQKTGKNGMFKVYATKNNAKSSLEVFDFNADDFSTPYQNKNDNLFVNANWKSTLGEKWSLKTGISYTNDQNENYFGEYDLSNTLSEIHVKANASYFLNEKVTFKIGGEQIRKELNTSNFDNSLKDNVSSAFTEANMYITSKLVLSAGLRLEHSSLLTKSKVSPRFSTAYKLDDNSQFSFACGNFFQNPSDKYLAINSKLGYENADHYILNYQIKKNDRLFRSEIYYKNYRDLLRYDNQYNAVSYQQNGSGYASGLDLFYSDTKSIKNSKFWISYSYLLTERKYRNFPEQATPTFAAKHHISLVYKYWMSKWNSYISITISASSPRPYNNPNTTAFNIESTKAYKTVNLSWSYLPKPNVVIYASATNILGFKNSFGYEYSPNADSNGYFQSHEILPAADRFFFLGCFLTFSKTHENQVDLIQ